MTLHRVILVWLAACFLSGPAFATSKDGTRVPYFEIAPKNLQANGKNPTLQYGYGGFEVSLQPAYSGSVGRAWLEKGGVYVVANIRGGGEYGPRWHQAALKANHVKYQEFVYPNTNHGFHNDSTPRYDEAAAKLAWQRTIDFFNANLRG